MFMLYQVVEVFFCVGWIFFGFLVGYVVFEWVVLFVVWIYIYYLVMLVFFGQDWGWIFIIDGVIFFDGFYNYVLMVQFECYVFIDQQGGL